MALARLEKMGSNMLVEMEKVRRRWDKELQDKAQGLEEKYQQKEQELQAEITQQKQGLDRRAAELDVRRQELDDRAAKHARRQHYKDIKDKFKSWSETFQVTPGTKSLRPPLPSSRRS